MVYTSTMIYGSGTTGTKSEPDAREKRPQAEAGEKPNEMIVNGQKMLQNPLLAPIGLLSIALGSMQQGGGLGAPMQARRFSPRGALVQEMTTTELTNKNIFGAGGSN